MKILNTLTPYKTIDTNGGIQYGVCREFNHISRYRGLRQIVHNPQYEPDRFVALETSNPFTTNLKIRYYDVPAIYENRLDIIADMFLGDATYSWVIAYFNGIQDGFTVREGTRLMLPNSVTDLFNKGEILQSISPTQLNLGSE
jgi:hypothetical protein